MDRKNMYISKIVIQNFKCFTGKHEIQFKPGVNYLVGNNNAGKTTIFYAIEFLVKGAKYENVISLGHEQEDVSVTITFSDVGPLKDSLSKYEPYRINNTLILCRSSKQETVHQGNTDTKMDIKTVRVFSHEHSQFENPTGRANTITALFDPNFVYADLHNEELQDFGTTKTTGKLISEVTEDFQKGPIFSDFVDAHELAFGENGIIKALDSVQDNINSKLTEQFGESKMSFHFDSPLITDFLKKGKIFITENGVKTDASEKGNGMQRALALAIIQVFSEIEQSRDTSMMQFFVDEPEIYLHPQAQDKLINALIALSSHSQIFVTTHSPYIMRNYRIEKDSITIVSATEGSQKRIVRIDEMVYAKPSIGEITFKAFGVPTIDFHQQLFTDLYLKWIETREERKRPSLSDFNQYLSTHYHLPEDVEFTPRYNGQWGETSSYTLPYVVRNKIDHPETLEDDRNQWKESELLASIKLLLQIKMQEA